MDLRCGQDKPGRNVELVIGNRNVKVKQSGSNQNIGERDSLGRRYRTGEAEESDVHLRMWRGELEKELSERFGETRM